MALATAQFKHLFPALQNYGSAVFFFLGIKAQRGYFRNEPLKGYILVTLRVAQHQYLVRIRSSPESRCACERDSPVLCVDSMVVSEALVEAKS